MPAILGAKPASDTLLNIVRPVLPDLSTFEADFRAALMSGQVTNNSKCVVEFERRIAEYLGVKHALPFVNGEAALTIMLNVDGLDGELIVPSYTFSGTVHAAIWNNLRPVFADIDPRTFTIDPASVESRIGRNTAGILAAPVYGNPCDNDALQAIADRHGIPLYYDSASGFGCTYKGRRLGGFGRAEIFSFHATKVFATMEGGALTTGDDAVYEAARQLRSFGQAGLVDCARAGINGKMMEVAALVGLRSLDTFDAVIAHRAKIAAEYEARLAGIPGLSVQQVLARNLSTRLYMAIVVDQSAFGLNADELVEALKFENIAGRRFLDPPIHRMSYYRNRFGDVSLPVTESIAARAVALPLYSDMTLDEMMRITDAVRRIGQEHAAIRARLAAASAAAPA
jgi:dTDP-4-amino-4,6-dideoxygalactose transaminase